VFIIPGERVKNGDDRLVVLNRVALAAVRQQRDVHPEHVFTYRGESVTRILNSAWLQARADVALPQVRVHDLKHTFGQRLRSAGVSFEDRQDLLGHRSARITTYYFAAELSRLLDAANSVCAKDGAGQEPEIVVLRRASAN